MASLNESNWFRHMIFVLQSKSQAASNNESNEWLKGVGIGNRRATVPYMQKKPFDLRRWFFVARFDLNFFKCLHCSSKSEKHKIGDLFIYL